MPQATKALVERPEQRVAIFIDGSNLYHALEHNCGRMDLNFGAFATKLCNQRRLYRTYYYNILQDEARKPREFTEQQRFLQSLYDTPYIEVRFGTSKTRGGVTVEKGVDIMLATDLLRYAWDDLYDVCILVSGDGDFAYALQAVKNAGKHVEVACFASNAAPELLQVADSRTYLVPEYFQGLWVGGGGGGPSQKPGRRRRRGGGRTAQPAGGQDSGAAGSAPSGGVSSGPGGQPSAPEQPADSSGVRPPY